VKDKRIPIARGHVVLLEERTALPAFKPLVGNAHPGPGDAVALWPAPAEGVGKKLTSTVLHVSEGMDGPVVHLVGTAAEGLTQGRLVDLYRGERFVGVGCLAHVGDPISQADMIASASVDEPAVGDEAVVRPAPGPAPHAVRAVVFNIQDDVCLLATGEADGVQVGEKFVVRRAIDGKNIDIAELSIYTVKIDYAGARIRLITPENHPVQKWDFAERQVETATAWRTLGTIQRLLPESRTAFVSLATGSVIVPGTVVRLCPKSDVADNSGAGIVLYVEARGIDLYIPSGWADLEAMANARIQLPEQIYLNDDKDTDLP
jgi:hypothetical protein